MLSSLLDLMHLEIVFKNSKKVIYEGSSENFNCDSQPRNIVYGSFSNEQTEIYTITPEHYQNVIDCGRKYKLIEIN